MGCRIIFAYHKNLYNKVIDYMQRKPPDNITDDIYEVIRINNDYHIQIEGMSGIELNIYIYKHDIPVDSLNISLYDTSEDIKRNTKELLFSIDI